MSKGQPGIANVNLIGYRGGRWGLRRILSLPIARAGGQLLLIAGDLALVQLRRAQAALRPRRA